MNSTRKKIIEAAEIEFAAHGFNGATIRDITNRAEVNIASVNYHFGSKEDLFKEMLRYRIEPINEYRLKLLDSVLEQNSGAPIPLQQIIDIIVRPLLTTLMSKDCHGFHFMTAIGKGLGEDNEFMKGIHQDILKTVIQRFAHEISRSLDKPTFPKMAYGMHFLSCSMIGAMLQHHKLELISDGNVDLTDLEALSDYLVAFISGGFTAISTLKQS